MKNKKPHSEIAVKNFITYQKCSTICNICGRVTAVSLQRPSTCARATHFRGSAQKANDRGRVLDRVPTEVEVHQSYHFWF